MKQPIKPKIPKPIFKKPKKWMPEVKKLPRVALGKTISQWELFIIHFKRWLESMTKETVNIGFSALFTRFKITIWLILIIIGLAIVVKILKG